MALELRGCLKQACDGLTLFDTTGDYSVDSPGGYGPENGVTGPLDFTTYTFRIWAPALDPSADDPTAVIDLKDPAPVGPDDDGNYRWDISLAELGLTSVEDGVWYAEAVGVKDGDIYEMPPLMPIFTMGLRDDLKERLLAFNPSSSCKQGCENPLELWMMLKTATCSGFCSIEQTRMVIAELKSKLPLCC